MRRLILAVVILVLIAAWVGIVAWWTAQKQILDAPRKTSPNTGDCDMADLEFNPAQMDAEKKEQPK